MGAWTPSSSSSRTKPARSKLPCPGRRRRSVVSSNKLPIISRSASSNWIATIRSAGIAFRWAGFGRAAEVVPGIHQYTSVGARIAGDIPSRAGIAGLRAREEFDPDQQVMLVSALAQSSEALGNRARVWMLAESHRRDTQMARSQRVGGLVHPLLGIQRGAG